MRALTPGRRQGSRSSVAEDPTAVVLVLSSQVRDVVQRSKAAFGSKFCRLRAKKCPRQTAGKGRLRFRQPLPFDWRTQHAAISSTHEGFGTVLRFLSGGFGTRRAYWPHDHGRARSTHPPTRRRLTSAVDRQGPLGRPSLDRTYQASCRLRRHVRRPNIAKHAPINPGMPAPAIGPGTANGVGSAHQEHRQRQCPRWRVGYQRLRRFAVR